MILYALLKILCIHISSFVHITKSGLNEAIVRQSFVLTHNCHDINKQIDLPLNESRLHE